jgi:hypothetical protein
MSQPPDGPWTPPPPGPGWQPPQGSPGAPPPYAAAPPAQKPSNRGALIAVAGVVVAAIASIIVIVLLSGGDDKKPAAAPSGAATSGAGGTGTAAPSGGATALTCADVQAEPAFHNSLVFKDGGKPPTGVDYPDRDPSLACSGATKASPPVQLTALAWKDVQLSDYVAQLTSAGWTDKPAAGVHVLDKSGSKYEIVAITVKGNLVAVYGPSS